MRRFLCFLSVFILTITPWLHAAEYHPDDFPARGEEAVAERYTLWIRNIIEQGLWSEALAGLERAFDFANVSSDISYLLALARSHEAQPRDTILEALEFALYVDNWNLYSSEDAQLLKAEYLVALREYPQALRELSFVSESLRRAELILQVLSATRPGEFRSYLRGALDIYPRESSLARLFFSHIRNEALSSRMPEATDIELIELLIRRLPILLPNDPELAWMAAPFLSNVNEARRLVSAYRAVNDPVPDSIPAALSLGIINEETALIELFYGQDSLDLALLEKVWDLLQNEESKATFRRNLSVFSGVIIEDADGDGFPETFAEYRDGVLIRSVYDLAQRRINDLTVIFEAGIARQALVLLAPDSLRAEAHVYWERYPAVLEVELEEALFIPRPLDFFYSPVIFVELWGSGVFFPRLDLLSPALTKRVLVFYSLRIERPSQEFHGGREVVELMQGIPVRAREFVGELMVAETEFIRGWAQFQRVDLDFDGHMETIRHFRQPGRELELEELWNYPREVEFADTSEK